MLLKKRLTVICCFFLLIQPIIISADCQSYISEITDTKVFTSYFKKSLYIYLSNPNSTTNLNLSEINATLYFYVNQPGIIDNNAICDQSDAGSIGQYNNVNLSKVIRKVIDLPTKNVFPRCVDDGTPYGDCSENKPFYCYSGILKPMCAGPDQILNTPDDCGCPADQLPCYDSTGFCNVECYQDSECSTSPPNTFCEGESLTTSTYQVNCVNNNCETGDPLISTRNCTREGKVCSYTANDCVMCNYDSDCPKNYTGEYECYDSYNINARFYDGICNSPRNIDSYCTLQDTPTYDYTYRSCNHLTEQCVPYMGGWMDCGECYPKSTPKHQFSITGGMEDYHVKLEIFNIDMLNEGIAYNYNFREVLIYEYKDGVYNDEYIYSISTCSPSCTIYWQRTSNPIGIYKYNATLINHSLESWYLPNDPSNHNADEFCFGYFEYSHMG